MLDTESSPSLFTHYDRDHMGTMWGPCRCTDKVGTTWRQHEDNVETTQTQCGDHRDVGTMWGQRGHYGDVETTWGQHGDNMEQHEDNVETTWGQIM